MIRFLLVILLFFSFPAFSQLASDTELDSLAAVYRAMPDSDTSKLGVCKKIAMGHYNADSTIYWSDNLMQLSNMHDKPYYRMLAYTYRAWAFFAKQEYLHSVRNNMAALNIADSIEDISIAAFNLLQLGDNNTHLNNYVEADRYYYEALDIYTILKDTARIGDCMRMIAENYSSQKLFADSERMFHTVLSLDSMAYDNNHLALDFSGLAQMNLNRFFTYITRPNMGYVFEAKRLYNIAYNLNTRVLANRFDIIYHLSKTLHVEIQALGIKGPRLQGMLDSLHNFSIELNDIADKLDMQLYKVGAKMSWINYYSFSKMPEKAKVILDSLKPLVVTQEIQNRDQLMDYYLSSDIYYRSVNDFVHAYTEKSKYYELVNSQTVLDFAVRSTQDMEHSKYQRELSEQSLRQRTSSMRLKFFLGLLALVASFLIIGYIRTRNGVRRLNHLNQLLQNKTMEVEKQSAEIKEQNSVITSSISYAYMIQQAVMPSEPYLDEMFGEHFVFFRPLQIVAGDFVWAATIGNYRAIVDADCTGHGVPGAFVSMLGISLLNEIAGDMSLKNKSAAGILNILRSKLMKALGQGDKYSPNPDINKDGIDMALVMIDFDNMEINYAGAFRPLWIIRDGAFIEYKPNRMPIGMFYGKLSDFSDNYISIERGDLVYIFTDGLTDQFGYIDPEHEKTKQFTPHRLRELLLEICHLPMEEQKQRIGSAIDDWSNGHRQIDDMSLVGIKI